MMRNVTLWAVLMVGLVVLSGCGRAAIPIKSNNGGCVSMADTVKTLRIGDELPRVVQVLGMPNRGSRAFGFTGRMYDVIEYDITPSACYKTLLDSEDKVKVVFDSKGKYMGIGDSAVKRARSWITVRTEALIVDPVVLRP